jgi:hypothetical protein
MAAAAMTFRTVQGATGNRGEAMLRRTVFAAAIMALVTGQPAAEGKTMTGGDVLEYCERPRGSPLNSFCDRYMVAYIDVDMTRGRLCPPPNVTYAQMKMIVQKFLKEHPELHHGVRSFWWNAISACGLSSMSRCC